MEKYIIFEGKINAQTTLQLINTIQNVTQVSCGGYHTVAITNGQLDFGPWEQIFYGEFDGKRSKRVLVKIIGE